MQSVKTFFNWLWLVVLSRPTVRKPLNTAWQAFLAVWLATGMSLTRVALTASLAAALSAFKTSVVEYVKANRS